MLGLVSPLLVVMSGTAGRHLQQSAANAPAAAPAEQAPPMSWGDRWDNGASLNYGSRVGEHMHGSHVMQDKCVTWNSRSQRYFWLAGFAAGAAIGIILLICVLILVCDRRRRPYVGSSVAQPLGEHVMCICLL